VAENIAYGDSRDPLDMEKIERAARLANAEEFIKKLPNGYNSHLGDRASSLSGGQRQRSSHNLTLLLHKLMDPTAYRNAILNLTFLYLFTSDCHVPIMWFILRLAIARAIYQDASILILDEATSALDNKSEELVREALEALMVGHTVSCFSSRSLNILHGF
jgi:putative ABC transport system ATP-binding protein